MISPSVQTATVTAYTATEPPTAVSPKPYPASSAEPISSAAGLRCSMKRVTGIWSSTISAPLTAMTSPKSPLPNPSRPIDTGSDTYACWKRRARRRLSPTTVMKRPSRATVSIDTRAGASPVPAPASAIRGRDSGSLRYTTSAQTRTSAASPRKSSR